MRSVSLLWLSWASWAVSLLSLSEEASCPCTMTKPGSPSNGNFGISDPGLCFVPPKVNLGRRAVLALAKSIRSAGSASVIHDATDLCLLSEQDVESRHGIADCAR